jgi:hypothetical protein
MPSKHLRDEPVWSTTSSADRKSPDAAPIRQQLDHLLADPHFRNSRRCQALLKHVVEAYLDGCLDRVKERSIGFEVFGRAADYDTGQDSIVRTSAGEVRKRLAQYYLEPEHEHEIRIVLPHGSYSPEFHMPAPAPAPQPETPVRIQRSRWVIPIASVAVAIAAAAAIYLSFRPAEFDRFWMPLFADRSETVICIEQPLRIYRFAGPRVHELNEKMVGAPPNPSASAEARENTSLNLSELETAGGNFFTYGDLIATARISELLGRKGKPFQILSDRATTYRDLRGKSAILLGQFNNQWTLGLTSGLRYYLEKNAARNTYEVRDRKNPEKVIASASRTNRAQELAIVSRIFDVSTERAVVAVTGATYYATLAGGDFLTHPSYMHEAFRGAPSNWYRKNIQVVLMASTVRGTPGPPQAIATYYW